MPEKPPYVNRFAAFDVGERQQLLVAVTAAALDLVAAGAGNLLPALQDELARSLDDVNDNAYGWVSSCCRADMTTRGGDGYPGSTCWAVCRACGSPCDPVAITAPTSGGPR